MQYAIGDRLQRPRTGGGFVTIQIIGHETEYGFRVQYLDPQEGGTVYTLHSTFLSKRYRLISRQKNIMLNVLRCHSG